MTVSRLLANKILRPIVLLGLVFLCLPFFAKTAAAASLYLSPGSKTVNVGENFSVAVYVSSPSQAMNAASGVLSFPQDLVQVTSVGTGGSIFSLWVQEPVFSNSSGSVNFEGIVLNPGYTGTGAKILSISFKAKAAGEANITFSSGDILANDGKGTNILESLSGAKISIKAGGAEAANPSSQTVQRPSSQPAPSSGLPSSPAIVSSSHPDQDAWYSNSNPAFSWELPKGVTAVRLSFDDKPRSQPFVVYTPPVSTKVLKDVQDGTWYFHAQFRNARGWGAVSDYRFQIDTTPPDPFAIKIIDGKEIANARPTILFNTTDKISGIDHYAVKIGESDFDTLTSDQVKSNPYTLPPQTAGTKTILVKALDRAGNYATATNQVTITSQQPPTITYFTPELTNEEDFVVRGITSPKSELIIWVLPEAGQPDRHIISSDESGNFSFIHPTKFANNQYYFWVVTRDASGMRSDPTAKYSFVVGPNKLARMLIAFWNNLATFILLVALVIVLLITLFHVWRRYFRLKRSLRQEIASAQVGFRQAFNLLRSDMAGYLDMLEKARGSRTLTKTEQNIKKQLKQNLDGMQSVLGGELKDIEEEIK